MKNVGLNRSFGLLLAAGCTVLAVVSYRAGRDSGFIWGAFAICFLFTAVAVPRILAPVRRWWIKLGEVVGRVVSPLILGIVYVVVFIPFGGLMRLFKRDVMRRKYDPVAASYWITRNDTPGSARSLKEQF